MQTAGFVPSCSALLTFYAFSVVSGLLLAEVNINTMCELGGGAVSLQVRPQCAQTCVPASKLPQLASSSQLPHQLPRDAPPIACSTGWRNRSNCKDQWGDALHGCVFIQM